MSTVRVRVRGPADKYTIWRRAQDLERWPRWMPLVRRVLADGPLRPGLEGEIVGVMGARGHFSVLDVDGAALSLTCVVRMGRIRVWFEHEADEGLATLVFSGPAPIAFACAPVARRGLRRLVAR